MRKEIHSTLLLDLKDTNNVFWWIILNVNITFFLFIRKFHRAYLRAIHTGHVFWNSSFIKYKGLSWHRMCFSHSFVGHAAESTWTFLAFLPKSCQKINHGWNKETTPHFRRVKNKITVNIIIIYWIKMSGTKALIASKPLGLVLTSDTKCDGRMLVTLASIMTSFLVNDLSQSNMAAKSARDGCLTASRKHTWATNGTLCWHRVLNVAILENSEAFDYS